MVLIVPIAKYETRDAPQFRDLGLVLSYHMLYT